MSSLVDLRPDRRLLDNDFEGYKLNLQHLPQYNFDLACPVDRVYPDEIQYSFIHARLFALHNHLVLDNWDYTFKYYYIDNKQQIRFITYENSNHSFQSNVVYDIPAHVERTSGHFNLSLSFPSDSLALVSDGTGYFHIVDTPSRTRPSGCNKMWSTMHSSQILDENKCFIIIDSKLKEKGNVEVIHCLLQSIDQIGDHFCTILTWVTFEKAEHSWKQTSFRQIQGKGVVHYAAIESNCSAIYIASDNPFKFVNDSENEIVESVNEPPRNILYTWLQTADDITITFKLQDSFDKSQMHFNVTSMDIKISYKDKIILDGKLKHKIDSDLTTWNILENGQVDVLLTKSDSVIWEDLIEGGDQNGEQILDIALVEEIHNRLEHLCSETEVTANQSVPGFSTQELEECDAASEEDTVLVRIDATNHTVTHRIPLSVHQFLFNIKTETQEVPALVLRHDVDACIWQPYAKLINTDNWPLKHLGTLMAFGYVQSSKQNRKFITCPPNFSYSVVCESSKHLFIYKRSGNRDCELRKRTGGNMLKINVGHQHVVNIDKIGEVLGINATNEVLFLLTEMAIVAIEIL